MSYFIKANEAREIAKQLRPVGTDNVIIYEVFNEIRKSIGDGQFCVWFEKILFPDEISQLEELDYKVKAAQVHNNRRIYIISWE